MPRREAGSIIIVWLHPVFQYISWKRHNYGSVSLLGLYRCTNQIKPAHRRVFFAGGYGFFRSCETRTRKEKFQAFCRPGALTKHQKLRCSSKQLGHAGTCWDMLDIGILSASHVRCQREIIACSVTFALRLFRVR